MTYRQPRFVSNNHKRKKLAASKLKSFIHHRRHYKMNTQALDRPGENMYLINDSYPGYTKNCDNSTTERQTTQYKVGKNLKSQYISQMANKHMKKCSMSL